MNSAKSKVFITMIIAIVLGILNYTFFKNELTDEGPWLNFSAQWSQRFKEKIFLTSSFKYNFLKFTKGIF